MRDTSIIIIYLLTGIVLGYTDLVPSVIMLPQAGLWILYVLLFAVGMSIGCDETLVRQIKSQNPLLLLIPIVTIVGTLGGSLLIVPFLPERTLSDCLAVASGMGYYSLSSILISEYKGADLGVVALISNILREVFVLVCAPLLVRYFGKLTPICCGGATTMDSTLPVIIRSSGNDYVILSIIHGVIVDFSVPFLVSFFCSL